MKKIATLALLPILWLTSCGKTQTQTPSDINENVNTNTEVQNTQMVEETSQTLNENITQTVNENASNVIEQAFDFNYEVEGNQVPVNGKFIIENGVVTDMIVNDADVNGMKPVDKFAKDAPSQIIWKSLNGLQIDSVSGASYVTIGFNQFLSTLQ